MKQIWTFAEAQTVSVISSQQVVRQGRPILFAARVIEDDSWIFLDADVIDAEDELIITLDEIIQRDPGIGELADLPPGWQARRQSIDEPWIRYPRCC